MDRTEAKKIFDDELKKLRWAMGLQDVDFEVYWGHIEGGVKSQVTDGQSIKGRCIADHCYLRAQIEIDENEHEDADDLRETLRHEMIHVLLMELELFRRQALSQLSDSACDALDYAWSHGIERTVGRIERMLDQGLGLTATKMIELSRKWNDEQETDRSAEGRDQQGEGVPEAAGAAEGNGQVHGCPA